MGSLAVAVAGAAPRPAGAPPGVGGRGRGARSAGRDLEGLQLDPARASRSFSTYGSDMEVARSDPSSVSLDGLESAVERARRCMPPVRRDDRPVACGNSVLTGVRMSLTRDMRCFSASLSWRSRSARLMLFVDYTARGWRSNSYVANGRNSALSGEFCRHSAESQRFASSPGVEGGKVRSSVSWSSWGGRTLPSVALRGGWSRIVVWTTTRAPPLPP